MKYKFEKLNTNRNKEFISTRILLLVVCFFYTSWGFKGYAQDMKITLQIKELPLSEVLNQIETKTGYTFLVRSNDVNLKELVTIEVYNKTVREILTTIFKKREINFEITGKSISIFKPQKPQNSPPASNPTSRKKITGMVKDEAGLPIIGATVVIIGAGSGTVTDINGFFSIETTEDSHLKVSYVGYESQTVEVKQDVTINISMNQALKSLEEIVVVGYSTQKKATVTGSVASIGTKDLLQTPQTNISNALVGRMSGLLAAQRSGEPGKDVATLRIRGVGTFAGSQDPLIMVDGIESTNYNNIDPNEIESLTILKDASATAVYGVRGANGVLLITTKRGEKGKLKVSLSSNVARSSFPSLRENMNSYEYASSYNLGQGYDAYVTGNNVRLFSPEAIELYKTHQDPTFYPDTDWYSLMLKDASYQTRSNLNISGGTEKVKYFFSAGYLNQNGMLNTSVLNTGYNTQIRYNRYNMRSNFDINLTKNLLISLDLSTQIEDSRGPNWDTNNLLELLSSTPPIISPGVINNKIVTLQSMGLATFNPLLTLNKGWHQNYSNNLNGSIRLNYKMDYLISGLSARATMSYKNYNTQVQTYSQNGIIYNARRVDDATVVYVPDRDFEVMQFSESVEKNRRIYLEGGFEYSHKFNSHTVGALILYNQSKYYDPTLAYLIPNGYQGVVGRVTYDFKNRYLAEYNLGYNGTENFAKGQRFGFFPAYSLGWVVTNESFFTQNKYLTFMKLRGSFGEVGNDKVGGDRFLYMSTAYTYNTKSYYFGEFGSSAQWYPGSNEGKLGNPDLTWERAKKMNIGVDIKAIDDKLSITVDLFTENRNNILTNRGTIPTIVGANFPAYNLGIMKNSGYEGEISYNDKIGDFSYSVKGNYTYAHNVIKFQDEAAWKYPYQYRTGQRYGQFFGYIADGLYNTWEEVNDANRPIYMWNNNKVQPGDIKYKDINSDGKIDSNDQGPIGYSNFPEIMFGLSLGGKYKGFDFSILFQGASNVSTVPSRRTMKGFYTNTGASKDLLKSWTYERYQQGEQIVYPRFSVTNNDNNYVLSTYWLEDASYVRLKNVEIGYTVEAKRLKKIGLNSFRVYMNGNNLITWCNLFPGEDPEFPTGENNKEPYPITRIYNVGFNVNF